MIIFPLAMVSACRERNTSQTIETLEVIVELDNSNYKGRIVTEETKDLVKVIKKLNKVKIPIVSNLLIMKLLLTII